jgi:hypothetical protein
LTSAGSTKKDTTRYDRPHLFQQYIIDMREVAPLNSHRGTVEHPGRKISYYGRVVQYVKLLKKSLVSKLPLRLPKLTRGGKGGLWGRKEEEIQQNEQIWRNMPRAL